MTFKVIQWKQVFWNVSKTKHHERKHMPNPIKRWIGSLWEIFFKVIPRGHVSFFFSCLLRKWQCRETDLASEIFTGVSLIPSMRSMICFFFFYLNLGHVLTGQSKFCMFLASCFSCLHKPFWRRGSGRGEEGEPWDTSANPRVKPSSRKYIA